MEDTVYRVGISGSYGGMNLGDEAILASVVHELRSRLPVEITVFTLNPEDTRTRHRVERVVPVRQLRRTQVAEEMRSLDLFILGGGGILYDSEARNFLREVQVAQSLGVPVMTWAIGVGPLSTEENRRLVLQTFDQIDVITVRDPDSQLALEDIGVVRDVVVTADPALLLEPQPIPAEMVHREGFDVPGRLIGLSVREPGPAAPDLEVGHYHALLANTADYLVERIDATILLFPMERPTDLQHAHAVVSRMANPQHALILKGVYTSAQVLSLMPRLEFAIGMRLHFLLFAALAGIPFVPLPYAAKVSAFVQELGMPTPPVQRMNAGQLVAYVDRSWDTRLELRRRVEERLPHLVSRARQTADLARDLLQDAVPSPIGHD